LNVIPVIDLKGGEVVRARGGARDLYVPIATPLAPTSRPVDVVAGFLALHPFQTIYVADLDAIEGNGGHARCLAELETRFPNVNFWVDNGVGTAAEATEWFASYRSDLVLGSESLRDPNLCGRLAELPRSLLSLDFRGDDFLGPKGLVEDEALWPARVVVMTLARVGSQAGPDLDRLHAIHAKAAGRHAIYAAGGVRGADDLKLLGELGIAGALVASALHDGHISASDLIATPQ